MPAGRPPKYNSPEEMQRIIDLYFLACKLNRMDYDKREEALLTIPVDDQFLIEEMDDTVPTMSGVAYYLGMSRQALCDYSNKDQFIDTIKRVRQRVEKHLEQRLDGPSPVGTIFNLKNNFGWKDKTEQTIGGDPENPLKTENKVIIEVVRPDKPNDTGKV